MRPEPRGASAPGGSSAGPEAPLRVLTFSSLYPSEVRPRHGIFVETRLRKLLADRPIDARVIAPVPWFPFTQPAFGAYAAFARTPRRAQRNGVQVSHPRYLMLPRVGVPFQPDAMAHAAWTDAKALVAGGWRPDIVDAHYFYPDGVAAATLARRLGVPFVVTARGSDVNLLGQEPGPRQRIVDAARQAAGVITVSAALKRSLEAMGVDGAKIVVLRNGVDTERFEPADRHAARAQLGLPDAPTLLCVGNLVPEKGFDLALDALALLPEMRLVLIGEGGQRPALQAQAERLGLTARVSSLPNMPQERLRLAYSAADALLLTSHREGWPNVVLEALACGTPVVGLDVGAVGEMLTDPAVGRIVAGRDAAALADAAAAIVATPPDRTAVRRHALGFDWASVSQGQHELFTRAIAQHRAAAGR